MTSVPLHHLESLAQTRLSSGAFAYVAGGAGAETTMRRNLSAWEALPLRRRMMRDLSRLDTGCSLLGLSLEFPCLVAPMAFQRLAAPEGERATALAAAAQGAGMVLSCQTSVPLAEAVVAPYWFQLYLQSDPAATAWLVSQAVEAGARALVVTIDAPVNGIRDREQQAGFHLPEDVRPVLLDPLPQPEQRPAEDQFAQAPTWADLAALCETSPVPVIAKGVLCAEDAALAQQCGCAGIIVSNHGGRVLDGTPATAEVLPGIRAELPEALILVDGGIRSGQDMVRALALGADAVLVGRPVFFALAIAGAAGVSAALRRLRDEFTVTMGLCGVTSLAEITPEALHLKL